MKIINYKLKIGCISWLFLIILFLLPLSLIADAVDNPQVYFRTTSEFFSPGTEFVVGVFVTSERPVNAYDFEIAYSPETLEFVSSNTNKSIIEFWRTAEPEIYQDGIIKLQGGSVTPFEGRAGEIIKLNFRAKTEGVAQWSFRRANMFYADGEGTAAIVEPSFMILEIKAGVKVQLPAVEVNDETPPVLSGMMFDNPLDGSKMASFVVKDGETGVKSTFLRWRKWLGWSDWEIAPGPVVRLEAGVWAFQFQSVDNRNNIAEETLYAWGEFLKKALLIVFFVILLITTRFFYVKIRKN